MVHYVTSLWLCIELSFEAMDFGVFTPFYPQHLIGFVYVCLCVCVCVCACVCRKCRVGPNLDFACVTFRVSK